MKQSVTIVSLLELPLRYIPTVAIQLNLVIIQLNLTFSDNVLIRILVLPPAAANIAKLLKILAILDLDEFFDATNPKIIFELEITFLVNVLEVKLALLQCLEKELIRLLLLKEVNDRTVKYFLYLLEFVHGPGVEQFLVDTPVAQLHIQHLQILFLLLVHLPTVPHKVDHQVEREWVAVYEYFIILHLQGVPTGKEGFESASFDMAQS